MNVKSRSRDWTHNVHTSKILRHPWRWLRAEAEACCSKNYQMKIICKTLMLNIVYIFVTWWFLQTWVLVVSHWHKLQAGRLHLKASVAEYSVHPHLVTSLKTCHAVVTGNVYLHVKSLGLGTCVLCCEDRPWLRNWTSKRTGRFIMFSVITDIYHKKTKGPTLMEFFTATGKLKKLFCWQLEKFDVCTTGDMAHIDTIFKMLPT